MLHQWWGRPPDEDTSTAAVADIVGCAAVGGTVAPAAAAVAGMQAVARVVQEPNSPAAPPHSHPEAWGQK
jgi:hypothetical protein